MATRVEMESIKGIKGVGASEEAQLSHQQKGKELADIFDQEKHISMQKAQAEEAKSSSSFWSKMAQAMPWNSRHAEIKVLNIAGSSTEMKGESISGTAKRPAIVQSDHQVAGSLTQDKQTVIEPIPALERPEPLQNKHMQAALDSPEPLIPLSIRFANQIKPIQQPGPEATKEEIEAYIVSIKDLMGKVFYLLQEQIDLEKDKGEISQEAMMKFHQIKKALDKVLDKLQEDLKHEQEMGNYFGYTQTAASMLASACAILSFIPKFGQLVAAPLGVVAAISSAIATAGKTYYGAQEQEHRREIDDLNYHQERQRRQMQGCFDDVSDALNISTQMYDTLIKIGLSNHKIKKILSQL